MKFKIIDDLAILLDNIIPEKHLSKLQELNPTMRVVINAISLETICQLKEILSRYPIEKEDIVQMNVSRSKKLGAYHLMQAENPVWICSFNFREDS